MKTIRRSAVARAAGFAAAGLLAASLAGCAGSGGQTAAAEIPAEGVDDGSTLTLWTRAPIEAQAKLLVEAYNDSHENQVELTVVPNDDYVAKVGAAAGSGGLPDLFAADVVYVPNWAEQGLFQDIAPLVDQLDYADEINPGHMSASTIDDAEYSLPFVLDLSVMMWNKDLVEQAGFDPEKAPESIAEFAEIARGVDELGLDGVSGTATGLNCGGCLLFTWFPSIWASGEEVLSEDGTEAMLDGDAAQEIYATWKGLADDGVLAPGSEDETGATWVAGFQEGKVGIMPYPATLLPSLSFDAGVAGLPGVDGGASTFVGGDSIGISKDSDLSGQAWNFLSWMMSEEAQVDVLAQGGNAVSRGDLADNEYASADPRLVAINEVAAQGDTPVATHFQEAFNAAGSPWLTLVRNEVLGDGGTLEEDNAALTEILSQ
ncbi:sugar ABC transporter substrate-binding protein [Microbacterium oryzae]|uniref:Sugar ABC transporter substrate-binding protein n=2 Tax=Microbacterium oryzae TaxID=743009 RepID=A0A6I6E3W7_9MICO|nr:sugar ABC transporter substrate-binding protein [Microbacterium oryzae]